MYGTIDYEAEYNNQARVPNHEQITRRWDAAAARFRDYATADLDVAYGNAARNVLDLFWPGHDRKGPIALYIHGGYWQARDKSSFSHFAGGLNANGIPVAIPSYRLCPAVGIADIIEDLRTCCRWMEMHYRRPVLAIGHSAGGHLAATLLASDWAVTDDRHHHRIVPAAVAISGIFDLEPLIHTSINANLHLTERTAHDLSPIAWTAPSGTWFTAVVGEEESTEFQRQARSIVDVWREAGVHTDLVVRREANHFTVVEGLADPADPLTVQIAALAHSLE